MIKFKTLKFKHYRQAGQLQARVDAGEAGEEDVLAYAVGLVAEWDLTDADTGEPLELGEYDEMTREQIQELLQEFAQAFEAVEVPKANAGPSSSTSMPSVLEGKAE